MITTVAHTQAIFIPETEELQNDINAILSQEGVEYVDLKIVPKHEGDSETFSVGGVWLIFKRGAKCPDLV